MGKALKIKELVEILLLLEKGDVININKKEHLIIKEMIKNLKYQIPAPVTEYIIYPKYKEADDYVFDICPNCGTIIERTYQAYCENCGQKLKWISWRKMSLSK